MDKIKTKNIPAGMPVVYDDNGIAWGYSRDEERLAVLEPDGKLTEGGYMCASLDHGIEMLRDDFYIERDPFHHEVKCWPEFYAKVVAREKPFEIRKNDRGYATGDTITLIEYNPFFILDQSHPLNQEGAYTGNQETFEIGYLLKGGRFGLEKGYVAFTLLDIPGNEVEKEK